MDLRIIEKIKAAGVVGAGGAGFPTHAKLNAQVDVVIANGAECEPLLRHDQQLMARYATELVEGMKIAMQATGAKDGIIGLKAKYKKAVEALKGAIAKDPNKPQIRLHLLEAVYPAGDEVMLVYESTGRIVPEGGIPLDVKVVVANVGTLINVAHAMKGTPVTHRYVTVAGAVKSPGVFYAPIGMRLWDLIEAAGGATVEDPSMILGGPMTGEVQCARKNGVTKTTSGIIVLPSDHYLVKRKQMPMASQLKRAKSACCQCTQCTELCPRMLIGHGVAPHLTMRAINLGLDAVEEPITRALLCCNCGLCSYYACPMELSPAKISQEIRREYFAAGGKNPHRKAPKVTHEAFPNRKVPLGRLVRRLGLAEYDVAAPLDEVAFTPREVQIPLRQHIGVPAVPIVGEGEKVKVGQLIAQIPEGKLGATVHASIDGTVVRIGEGKIVIQAK